MFRKIVILTVLMSLTFVGSVLAQEDDEVEIPVYDVLVTEDGIEVPEDIEPGIVTLRYDNSEQEEADAFVILIQLNEGVTPEDFFAFMEAEMSGGSETESDEIGRIMGGPAVAAGESVEITYELAPAQYIFLDFAFTREMPAIRVYEVSGEMPEEIEQPEADIEAELIDYSFVLPDTIEAGEHLWRFSNEGEEDHEFVLMRLKDQDATLEDIMGMMGDESVNPDDHVEGVFTIAGLGPEAYAWATLDLEPGVYLMTCFVSTDDGTSHAEEGMIRLLTVE